MRLQIAILLAFSQASVKASGLLRAHHASATHESEVTIATTTDTRNLLQGACAPEWQLGAPYVAGSLVSKGCQLFKCKFTAAMPTLDKLCNQVGFEPLSTAWGGGWQHAWESLGDCCGSEPSPEPTKAPVTKNPTPSPTVAATSPFIWYADFNSEYSVGKCIKTLPQPSHGSRTYFASQLECCAANYGAQTSGACIQVIASPSATPTNVPTALTVTTGAPVQSTMTCTPRWYVRSDGNCVMSCEVDIGGSCGGLASSSDLLFGRKSECPSSSRPSLSPAASPGPTLSVKQCCSTPLKIPSRCEMDILIDMMEVFVLASPKLLAQWTRAAFHDAGTFDQAVPEGGANGCLLNDPRMHAQPENNHLGFDQGPLFTLSSIKSDWMNHLTTCIAISSADILQFAIFFATTRQKDTPKSLLLHSASPSTAIAKRETLKNDFLWGRPDEDVLNCDPAWTDNLPGPNTGACGGNIPCRCAMAGDEIQEKMMNRNGFTAEEANALIGAHTIGLIRNTFGVFNRPWVHNGRDFATPSGPVFDNAYHDFLVNSIVANDIPTFAANTDPFTEVFGNWFLTGSKRPTLPPFPHNDINHLDTDIVLAFPPLSTTAHPDYSVHTHQFAGNNTHFLNTFFNALHKMSTLGVNASLLSPATECKNLCNTTGARKLETAYNTGLSIAEIIKLITHLGNATAYAEAAIARFQATRLDEIDILTTKISVSPGWHNHTLSITAKPSSKGPTSLPTTAKPGTTGPTTTKPL